MKSDYIVIRIYNNNTADVELDGKTIYTNKEGAYGFIALARRNEMKQVAWKRYENGDQVYWFN